MRMTKEEIRLILQLVDVRRHEFMKLAEKEEEACGGIYKVMYDSLNVIEDKLLGILNSPLPRKKITVI